ncbi:YqhR family membrane protein [Paenibacillus sp. TRM 82003]|nr:YqhR family membrane protein [Paenibacillus sp. TRM 82003]
MRTNRFLYALEIGFFAGLIWGGVRWLFVYFGFTDVVPGFLVEPFFTHDFLSGTGGYLVGYASFIAMSIVAALIYALVGYKLKGPWPGVAYGILWFVGLYLLIGPMVGMLPPLGVNDWDSIWSDFSVFVLWGVFIGYTITLEFTDERSRDSGNSSMNLQ